VQVRRARARARAHTHAPQFWTHAQQHRPSPATVEPQVEPQILTSVKKRGSSDSESNACFTTSAMTTVRATIPRSDCLRAALVSASLPRDEMHFGCNGDGSCTQF